MTTAILWFKNDLRLHDHPALLRAASSNHLLPIYIADPRQWRLNDLGLPKSGPFRFRFLQESLADLQESLLQLGSDLRIVNGFPEEILPELFRRYPDAELFAHLDPGTEEATVREALANLLPAGRVHFFDQVQVGHYIRRVKLDHLPHQVVVSLNTCSYIIAKDFFQPPGKASFRPGEIPGAPFRIIIHKMNRPNGVIQPGIPDVFAIDANHSRHIVHLQAFIDLYPARIHLFQTFDLRQVIRQL